jgi:adenosylhomocysteinase
VLGYGKIGRSIAHHLRLKSVLTKVLDTNPSRQVLALAHGFQTSKKENLIAEADMIFCATGNRSLKRRDLASIKRDAYIFTATSGDDEIEDHAHLMQIASHDGRQAISRVELDSNRFHICNNGNSVNFVHGGVVGPYIRLVQAELVFALSQLSEAPSDKITELDYTAKRFIADAWMTRFST